MVTVDSLKVYEPDMISWRRDFHKHPEIGFTEVRTSKIIADLLESFGLEVVKNFAKTAVIGILDTGKPGKVVGIRADIDALPMQDLKTVPYKSINPGVCHACGHDGHTAILLGTAKYFSEHREGLVGKIKFIFQPAEEGPSPGGAKYIMESGMLDDVDVMLGAHTHPLYPSGKIIVKYDELFASGDSFEVKITGVGVHGAFPHQGKDCIITATQIISAFQNIVTRQIDATKPVVFSVCKINAGSTNNVIPQEITFGGTIRTLDEKARDYILCEMERIVKYISEINGCKYEFTNSLSFPLLKNNNEITKFVENVAIETVGSENVSILPDVDMSCEDFSYYANKIPSSYFYFGVRNESKNCCSPFHHPTYDIDEDSFCVVQAVFINTTLKLLSEEIE